MENVLVSKFEEARQQLLTLQEELTARRDRVIRVANRERSVRLGRARQLALGQAYERGEALLRRTVDAGANIGPVRKHTGGLERAADRLGKARVALSTPAIEDYDSLNVSRVIAELGELSDHELTVVREYEKAHKDRVTVLRDIERRLR